MNNYIGLPIGFTCILIWHFAMNTGVYLDGWYGEGLIEFWTCQFMGIPFLVDHWIKWALVYATWKAYMCLIEKVAKRHDQI